MEVAELHCALPGWLSIVDSVVVSVHARPVGQLPALDQLSPAEHAWLRNSYRRPAGDDGFESRLRVWDRLLATRWALRTLHWLWSKHHGPDRERLTQPVTDAATLRALLIRFIERAERVATGAAPGLGYG